MGYRNELITMYASLEKNPVVVSYPDGQPSKSPQNKEERWKLNNFMDYNRFQTIYTFGDCKIVHYVSELSYRYYGVDLIHELRFYNGIKTYDFASVRYYHLTDKQIDDDKKQLIQLYQDVKHKSRGKPFTNPYEKYLNDNIFELQLYARNALPFTDAENVIADLDKIKTKLLASQNINYKERNK